MNPQTQKAAADFTSDFRRGRNTIPKLSCPEGVTPEVLVCFALLAMTALADLTKACSTHLSSRGGRADAATQRY